MSFFIMRAIRACTVDAPECFVCPFANTYDRNTVFLILTSTRTKTSKPSLSRTRPHSKTRQKQPCAAVLRALSTCTPRVC